MFGNTSQDCTEGTDAKSLVSGDDYPLMRRTFGNECDMATDLPDSLIGPVSTKTADEFLATEVPR